MQLHPINNGEKKPLKKFTDLLAWREAHQLAVEIYKASKKFPKEDLYGVTSQIRRSGLSVSSNIAEGFARRSRKEKIQFYTFSLSSLREVQNQLLFCKAVGILASSDFDALAVRSVTVSKLTSGLLNKIPR